MNPQLQAQISAMIQQAMNKSSQTNRFNLSNTTRHIHNGTDAPYVFQPTLIYGGSVTSSGDSNFMPTSFSMEEISTGNYLLTHNLNTEVYVANAVPQGTEGIGVGITQNKNTVEFSLFNTFNFNAESQPFTFTITVFNNKLTQLPSYSGSFITSTQVPSNP